MLGPLALLILYWYYSFVCLYVSGVHLSFEGILHLSTVEYFDITAITNQYQTRTFETWKMASSMRRARSGFALFSPKIGVLSAVGGWPLMDEHIRVEENKDLVNGNQWTNADMCMCIR